MSPTRIVFFNPAVNQPGGPNGAERRELVLDFATDIFANASQTQVGVTIFDGQGICTRYPISTPGFIDCDSRSGTPFINGTSFTDARAEDADAALPLINGLTSRNFERERFRFVGVGTTNALVRTSFPVNEEPVPAGLSALALAPLASLRNLRQRYAVLSKEDRQG